MQIHEITRKQINEAVPGSAGAQAGVAASGFAGALTSKLLPGANTAKPTTTVGASQRAGEAHKINQALIGPLAQKAQLAWTQVLKKMVSDTNNKALSPAQLDLIDVTQALNDTVNNLLGFDRKTLSTLQSVEAKASAENLQNAFDEVLKASRTPQQNDNLMKTAWYALAQSVMEAQNAKNFAAQAGAPGTGAGKLPQVTMGVDGKLLYDGRPFNPANPAHVQMQQTIAQQAAAKR
jgi:hypothetical protein